MKHICLLLFFIAAASGQDLVINEFMASNDTTVTDPDYHVSADWIEIYNAGQSEVDINRYFLTDDLSNPAKWQITSQLLIGPGDFVLIWADGAGHDNHAGFNLAREGESIGLYRPDLIPVDTFSYSVQMTDVSSGRYPDGGSEWLVFSHPTPGTKNGSGGALAIAPAPDFSHASGFYDSQINVEIYTDLDSARIYYTKDGSTPTSSSQLYTGSVNLRRSTILRAIAYRSGYLPGPVRTMSYMMFVSHSLPLISLATDPDNFFDDQIGIYVAGTNGIPGYCSTEPRNWNQDWERPVHVDLFEPDGSLKISQDAGIKITGECTRLYPEKSLELNARNIYGYDRFRYRVFKDKPIQEFKSLKLRSSAQDWWRSMFRDGMIHTLVGKSTKLDYQAYRPAVVYLNGEYWGIHNLREKGDENFVYNNYGLDPENLDLIKISKSGYATSGDIQAYNHLMDYVAVNDLSIDEHYKYVCKLIDVDNYLEYQIFEIYIANRDWPGNNQKLFRQRESGSKWRWLLYDLDMGFGGNGEAWYDSNTLVQATEENGPNWPNPPWSTLLFRKLLENDEFRSDFIQRFMIFLSNEFTAKNIFPLIDSLKQNIASEIPRHKEKWPKSISYTNTWQEAIDIIREFSILRPEYIQQHLTEKFNLAATVNIVVTREHLGMGILEANKVPLRNLVDTLKVFSNLPVTLTALAMPGFHFDGWQGDVNRTDRKLMLIPEQDYFIKAVFQPDSAVTGDIVLNEINYNSAQDFDARDWVELYNNSDQGMDISGYYIRDDLITNRFDLPAGTYIAARDYLVLSRDTLAFKEHFPAVHRIVGNLLFGLDANGEHLRLCRADGTVVDSLTYGNTPPWPVGPDGNGPALALRHPDLDNSDPDNWLASGRHGTPGALNDVFLDMEREQVSIIPEKIILMQNYPNPFNHITTISFALSDAGKADFYVYDIRGKEIDRQTGNSYAPGWSKIRWVPPVDLASGVYFYLLRASEEIRVGKLIYLK